MLKSWVSVGFLLACSAGSTSVDVSGTGVSDGMQTRLLVCESSVTLTRYEAGGGPISVMVTDGQGHRVFEDDTAVVGEVNDTQSLPGSVGGWSLAVDPTGFSGQFTITLRCE